MRRGELGAGGGGGGADCFGRRSISVASRQRDCRAPSVLAMTMFFEAAELLVMPEKGSSPNPFLPELSAVRGGRGLAMTALGAERPGGAGSCFRPACMPVI